MTQTFLAFRPRRAATQEVGRLGVALEGSYSSNFTDDSSGGDSVTFDGEVLYADARLRFGVGVGTDVEIEIPVMYASSGFLDKFIDGWHDVFGLESGNRDSRPSDQFAMNWEEGGTQIYEMQEDSLGFADIPVVVTHVLVEENGERFGVSLRAGVELPTGSESRGFSNGRLDYGVGVLTERSLGRWTVTSAFDFMVTGRPDSYHGTDADADDLIDLQLGLEYRWNDHVSLLGQMIAMSALEPSIDLPHTDREILDLVVGFAWDVSSDSFLTVSLYEDLVSEAGPDLALAVSWAWRM